MSPATKANLWISVGFVESLYRSCPQGQADAEDLVKHLESIAAKQLAVASASGNQRRINFAHASRIVAESARAAFVRLETQRLPAMAGAA